MVRKGGNSRDQSKEYDHKRRKLNSHRDVYSVKGIWVRFRIRANLYDVQQDTPITPPRQVSMVPSHAVRRVLSTERLWDFCAVQILAYSAVGKSWLGFR